MSGRHYVFDENRSKQEAMTKGEIENNIAAINNTFNNLLNITATLTGDEILTYGNDNDILHCKLFTESNRNNISAYTRETRQSHPTGSTVFDDVTVPVTVIGMAFYADGTIEPIKVTVYDGSDLVGDEVEIGNPRATMHIYGVVAYEVKANKGSALVFYSITDDNSYSL